MGSSYKTPPAWPDEKPYDSWKNEIEIWKSITDLPDDKKGLAVALTLDGKKREVEVQIPVTELKADDRLDKVMAKLKEVFDADSLDKAFEEYFAFESVKRTASMSINEYIIEFESRYPRIVKHKMTLPEGVLACKLLYGAGLRAQERRIVLTATNQLDLVSMKSTLRRVFATSTEKDDGVATDGPILLKDEPAFVAENATTSSENTAFWSSRGQAMHRGRGRRQGPYDQPFRGMRGGKPRGRNPVGHDGKISVCNGCGSRNHWYRNCPDRPQQEVQDSTDHSETGFLSFAVIHSKLVEESKGKCILDSACTATVAGEEWVNDYISRLDDEDRNCITRKPSHVAIKFGGGEVSKFLRRMDIPIQFGSTKCFLSVEVVSGNLPLLFSVKSLSRAKMTINFERKVVIVIGEEIPLVETSTGHLAVPIVPKNEYTASSIVLAAHNGRYLAVEEIEKLHRQFGHCSADKLRSFLKTAAKDIDFDMKSVTDVVSKCETCKQFGKAAPRPVVSMQHAKFFNDLIAMDLHFLQGAAQPYFLHIIDHFTRFSQAVLIADKKPQTILNNLNKSWIFQFGCPKRILTDNGGEFLNEEMTSNSELMNIKLLNTAAESPWSNGTVERHNLILTEMFEKTRLDGIPDDISLQQAVFAKNAMLNFAGFSPYQLVYGRNPNIPTVANAELPALENETSSQIVQQHLTALNRARKAFVMAESSEKIRRALKHNVREPNAESSVGDTVYYKRKSNKWRGPAKVVGMDGKIFLVKHGSQILKIHWCRVRPSSKPENIAPHVCPPQLPVEASKTVCEEVEDDQELTEDKIAEEKETTETTPPGEKADPSPQPNLVNANVAQLPRLRDYVKIVDRSENDEIEGTVVSRGGKAVGKYKNWFNVEITKPDSASGVTRAFDFGRIDHWECLDQAEALATGIPETAFEAAKLKELASWTSNDVFCEVPYTGQATLETRWVLTEKDDGSKKARLVVRGFQDPDVDKLVKDSPTCSKETFRLVLSVFASLEDWKFCEALDVRTAFLQGIALDREVYLKPPRDFESTSNVVWKLKKCVYGLADASRCWYERLSKELQALGGERSTVDNGLFIWKDVGCVLNSCR